MEVPRYNKKATGPVQVQFYVSNGKRRKSLAQNFTYLPVVGCHLTTVAGTQLIKQEHWDLDHISHNPPGFSTNVAFYDSSDLPVHCGPPSQDTPRLHHPPPSSVPLFPHTSSSIPPHSSSVPHPTLIPLQTSIMTPQTFTMPPQTSPIPSQISTMSPQTSSVPPQVSTMPPQTSSVLPQVSTMRPQTSSIPLQISTMPRQSFTILPQTSSLPLQAPPVGPQREHSPCLSPGRSFMTPTDAQKNTLSTSPGQVLSIKQEPEDQPNLGSVGLQEITLDDGKHLGVCTYLKTYLKLMLSVSINLFTPIHVSETKLNNRNSSLIIHYSVFSAHHL